MEKLLCMLPILAFKPVSIGIKKAIGMATKVPMIRGHVVILERITGSVVSDCLSGVSAKKEMPMSYRI